MGLLKCLIKNKNLDEMHKQSLADKTSEYQAQGMEESIADSLAISELVTELKGDLANIKSLVGIENSAVAETIESTISQEQTQAMQEAYAKIDAMLESNEITVTCKI